MDRKSIMFIIPTLSNGGAERVVARLSTGFSDEIKRYIVVYNLDEENYEYNAEIINLDMKSTNNYITKIKNNITRIKKIKKIKKELNIDYSISFMEGPNLINILTRNKEKILISIRNFKSREQSKIVRYISKFFIKSLYNKADKVVAISEGVKNDLIKNYGVNKDNIQVIYNPLNLDMIKKQMKEPLDENEREIFLNPTIINVGRLTYQKGQWHLIRAFKKVVQYIPNAQLIILGQGELKGNLEILIKNLGLTNNVFLEGFKKNPFKYIHNSTMFVFSSLYEGLGNVLIESMACQVPVISTDCPAGPREIIDSAKNSYKVATDIEASNYGILIPNFNNDSEINKSSISVEEEKLADVIIDLLNDKEKINYYKKQSSIRANDYSIEDIVNQWLTLINKL